MKFNGIELVEMIPENWDGKTRKMIVWCNEHTIPEIRTICGYDPIHFGWIAAETLAKWNHCAEIPEETYITNNLTEEEIIEKFKTLRTELFRWLKNNDTRNLLVNNLQYGIKTALNVTNINKHLSEVVDFSKIDTNTKKIRVMTNKELAEWLAKGNGVWAWCNYATGVVGDSTSHKTTWEYRNENANEACTTNLEHCIRIKGWDETKWCEPLIEE